MKWKISNKAIKGSGKPFDRAVNATYDAQSMYAGIPASVNPYFRTAYYPTEKQAKTAVKRCRDWVDGIIQMMSDKLELNKSSIVHAFVTDNKRALYKCYLQHVSLSPDEPLSFEQFCGRTVEALAFACTLEPPVLNDDTVRKELDQLKAQRRAHNEAQRKAQQEATAAGAKPKPKPKRKPKAKPAVQPAAVAAE